MRIFTIIIILILSGLIITSCGGGGSANQNTFWSRVPAGNNSVPQQTFSAYVYVPVQDNDAVKAVPTRTGMVILQESVPPKDYIPVEGATVCLEDEPSEKVPLKS
jgi:hypothetical protein